tara:strand:+ start:17425 stop:17874 length:450 start_codon:yes stop_codon:yes gene_type:complete
MKPFKYKLSSVLKLREFEKQKIENQLSVLNKEILEINQQILNLQQSILNLQSNLNQAGENGNLDLGMIKYFPEFLSASEKEIANLTEELEVKQSEREKTLKLLDESMAKVKILENDKIRKQKSYKFKRQKKENLDIEDMQIILRGRGSA